MHHHVQLPSAKQVEAGSMCAHGAKAEHGQHVALRRFHVPEEGLLGQRDIHAGPRGAGCRRIQEPALLVAETRRPMRGGNDGPVGRNQVEEVQPLGRGIAGGFVYVVGVIVSVRKLDRRAQHGV